MMGRWRSPRGQFIVALGVMSLISLGLFAYGVWHDRNLDATYLTWNLFLAWLPLIFAIRLTTVLRRKLWSSWEALAMSVLWFVFLPNSFYLISDFIHLQEVPRADILYDSLMFTAYVTTGVVLGFSSLFLVHLQLRRRFGGWQAETWVSIVLLLCSAAIYLGRDLRWNTWDILVNPGGLLFDVSERLAHPGAYPNMVLIIVGFFVVLAGMYHALWRGTRLFVRPALPRHQDRPDASHT